MVGSHADHVLGMDPDEGRALLADLLKRATRPERVLRHDWAVGDMVMWDNTGVVHRVSDHNPTSAARTAQGNGRRGGADRVSRPNDDAGHLTILQTGP